MWLANEFTGGDLVGFAEEATCSVEGTDQSSSSYGRGNWLAGLTSGALYAFRSLRIPRQRVVVSELSGRLGASDMVAVANCSAIAISHLAERELPGVFTEDWHIRATVAERTLPNGPVRKHAEPDAPAEKKGPGVVAQLE
jgi:hypothetical protein